MLTNTHESSKHRDSSTQFVPYHREYKLAKVDFPKFDGEHPQVWRDRCEKYFAMFNVPPNLWAPLATISFRGNAMLWLQTYEAQHTVDNWHELCIAVDKKFGRDLCHNYMRDLLNIRQTQDVLEYANRFKQAKHRVLCHNRDLDEVFFVQKFMDGLRYNISNAIALHKPRTVDAALSLALMQEELLEASTRRYHSRAPRDFTKTAVKSIQGSTGSILGNPPPSGNHGSSNEENPAKFTMETKPKWDTKLSALQAQRRKLGLCMKCGDKWGKNHKCPQQIPLHVLEEFLDAINLDPHPEEDTGSLSSDEELLTLSVSAVEGIQGRKTIRLQGLVNKQEVLILLDSGSSTTFISAAAVQRLGLSPEQTHTVQVSAANGGTLTSTKSIPNLTWWTQGHTFTCSARVLDLKML